MEDLRCGVLVLTHVRVRDHQGLPRVKAGAVQERARVRVSVSVSGGSPLVGVSIKRWGTPITRTGMPQCVRTLAHASHSSLTQKHHMPMRCTPLGMRLVMAANPPWLHAAIVEESASVLAVVDLRVRWSGRPRSG